MDFFVAVVLRIHYAATDTAEKYLDEMINLGFASNNPGVKEYRCYNICCELTSYYS